MVGVFSTVAAATLLSACAADQPAGSGSGEGARSGLVATRDVPGVGTVLVDTGGRTLYFTDSDQAGTIKCTADCLELWHPVMAPGGQISDAPVSDLGSVTRPEGTSQLAYQNKPLYTFALDGPDKPASGNNATDSFGGVDFTWHAVVLTGGGQAPPPSDGGGYGGGPGY
jgi:predicted lipoprotein with Yx(FWY)xxD motif